MKDKLAAKETLFGLLITWANPGFIEAIGGKYEFCMLDAQHGLWGFVDLISGIRACELVMKKIKMENALNEKRLFYY